MQEGRVPGKSAILGQLPAGNILVSRPADESGLKPSLATTTAKASERVIADPLARVDREARGAVCTIGAKALCVRSGAERKFWEVLGTVLLTCI